MHGPDTPMPWEGWSQASVKRFLLTSTPSFLSSLHWVPWVVVTPAASSPDDIGYVFCARALSANQAACEEIRRVHCARDISLDVLEGEFVCFLGPSGCGKTTLLRAIAGLDIQTTGTVEQAGADISALPPSERDFGIVFQSYALFPNMTVTRNVAYGLESQRRSRAEVRNRVRDLLDLVGLPDQATSTPAQLSGGQQQRIALARAIAMSPGLCCSTSPSPLSTRR